MSVGNIFLPVGLDSWRLAAPFPSLQSFCSLRILADEPAIDVRTADICPLYYYATRVSYSYTCRSCDATYAYMVRVIFVKWTGKEHAMGSNVRRCLSMTVRTDRTMRFPHFDSDLPLSPSPSTPIRAQPSYPPPSPPPTSISSSPLFLSNPRALVVNSHAT